MELFMGGIRDKYERILLMGLLVDVNLERDC